MVPIVTLVTCAEEEMGKESGEGEEMITLFLYSSAFRRRIFISKPTARKIELSCIGKGISYAEYDMCPHTGSDGL